MIVRELRMKKTLRIAFFIFFNSFFFTHPLQANLSDWIKAKLPYKLPPEKLQFEKLKPPSNSSVLDRNGKILFYLPTNRIQFYKSISELPLNLQNFVVLAEDAKFFEHEGFDLNQIENSLKSNLSSNKIKRGGSTITQQLAKNLFLDKKRSYTRKLFEIPWALQLERDLSKKQILELYLNIIEWGPGLYGAEAASRHFFDKEAKDLNPRQSLYLALIVPNPPRFDLFGNAKKLNFLESKKKSFVNRIFKEKKISLEEKNELLKEGFQLAETNNATRTYPLQHSASYEGNWKVLDKNWDNLPSYLQQKKPLISNEIKTSLVKNFEKRTPYLNFEGHKKAKESHYLVWRDDLGVQSFKKIEKNHEITDPSSLPSGLKIENDFSLEEVLYVIPSTPAPNASTGKMEGG
jgi:membrane peptidoglycan carboxypeptidase